jgi:DNA-binding Lrp family transcriptional regulator
MRDHADVDEFDLALLHALQINPRASWTLIGQVFGVNPATAARRWARMTGEGIAWVTVYLGAAEQVRRCAALVEVSCEAGQTVEVARRLAADPRAANIMHATGDRDLLLNVFLKDMPSLSGFLLDELGRIPGVRGVRSHVVTHVHSDGSAWRLSSLDTAQLAALRPPRRHRPAGAAPMTEADRRIIVALGADGRLPYTALAGQLGMSVNTVRRRLDRLLADDQIVLRCDLAQALSEWPATLTLWGTVPPPLVDKVVRDFATIRETRLVLSLTGGAANQLGAVWMRTPTDIGELEAGLGRLAPEFTVVDRCLGLRYVKHMGQLLDADGYGAGMVPLDVWADFSA